MKYLVLFVNTLGRLRCVRRGRHVAGAPEDGREAAAARSLRPASALCACVRVRECVCA